MPSYQPPLRCVLYRYTVEPPCIRGERESRRSCRESYTTSGFVNVGACRFSSEDGCEVGRNAGAQWAAFDFALGAPFGTGLAGPLAETDAVSVVDAGVGADVVAWLISSVAAAERDASCT